VAFALLWLALNVVQLPTLKIQTLTFVYLMYSAQATIYISRVPGRFWSLGPSRFVAATTLGNVLIASVLGAARMLMTAVPVALLALTLGVVVAAAVVLDQIKISVFDKTGLLGEVGRSAVVR